MAVLLVFVLLPFYFIFVTAFKSTLQIQQITSMFWPTPWTLEHFTYIFTQLPFAVWYRNTIIVAIVSTIVAMFCREPGRLRAGPVALGGHRTDQHPGAGCLSDAAAP